MRTNAHIVIDQTLMPGQPPIDLELNSLKAEGLILINHEHPIEPQACMEWAITSVILAYISKSYFDGFLGEMGADHYGIFKEWVLRHNKKFKGIKTYKITATKTTQQIYDSNSPNNFFALYFQIPQGNVLKVFMPNTASDENDVKALSELFANLMKLYKKPKSKFAKKINSLTDNSYDEIFGIYAIDKCEWEFFTSEILIKREIYKRNGNN